MEQSPLPGQQSFLMTSRNGMLVSVPADKLDAWQRAQADNSPEAEERRKRTSEMIMRTLNELRSANALLPFSQEKSKIPVDTFEDRFRQEKQKYPFVPAYAGKNNPYDTTIIETEADYDRYLREHTYHILCEEATVRTVKQHDEILVKERDTLQQKLNDASSLILSMDDRFNSETSRLHDEFDALTEKHEKARISYKRTRRLLLLAVAVLLVFSVLTCCGVISFDSRPPARTYDQGYAAGQAAQESADAGLYDEGYSVGEIDGYAKGKESGYASGYSDGKAEAFWPAYWEGFKDADSHSSDVGSRSDGYQEGYQDGSSGNADAWEQWKEAHGISSDETPTRSGSGNAGTETHRDAPIANTYLGNSKSKKFHLPSCSYLPDSDHQVTFASREDAIAAGYSPCGHCKP